MGGIAPLIEDLASEWSTFIFWDVLPDPAMTTFHQSLLHDLLALRSPSLLPVHQQLLADATLPVPSKNSLKLYGTLFAGETERPHFTLTRLKHKKDVPSVLKVARGMLPQKPPALSFDTIWLANAGPNGVVTELFDQYSLSAT